MIVMKAMGMESDQEVVQMIGRDPRYSALLLQSIEVCVWSRKICMLVRINHFSSDNSVCIRVNLLATDFL